MNRSQCAAAWSLGVALLALTGWGVLYRADAETPEKLTSTVKPEPLAEQRRGYGEGLTLAVEPVGRPGQVDVRRVRLAALYVPEGESASVFTSPGPFRATFTGLLRIPLRGNYKLSAGGNGRATIIVNDVELLTAEGDDLSKAPAKEVEMKKGRNAVVVKYKSPASGDAQFRLYWESIDFPRETVPPSVWSHYKHELPVREGERRRLGRQLVATHRCLKCHQPEASFAKALAMPELADDAPNLTHTGNRLNAEWIAAWMANPHAMRPTATMPNVLAHLDEAERGKAVADITAALSLTRIRERREYHMPLRDGKALAKGGDLYARLGCVGCHVLPDHNDESTLEGRIPLYHVKAKFKPHALVDFLLRPEAHYAAVRMPNFGLSVEEARVIAGFVLSRKGKPLPDTGVAIDLSKGDVKRGEALMTTLGCMACHKMNPQTTFANKAKAPSLSSTVLNADWKRGCMADDDDAAGRGKAPQITLDDDQRDALRAFAATDWSSLTRASRVEFSQRQFKTMRCDACHDRDGYESWWASFSDEVAAFKIEKDHPEKPKAKPEDDPFGDGDDGFGGDGFEENAPGEGGAPPVDQSRPDLSLIGEKLRPSWMAKFMSGQLDYKPRPWMQAKMPSFGQRGAMIAYGTSMAHGFPPTDLPQQKSDPQMAAAGRKLAAPQGGLACISCHGIGKMKPTNVFEAQGVNFQYTAERLNHEYYHRWMMKPTRIAPQTRMPKFADDKGRTPLTEYYDGDARKQFEAVWHYILTGRKIVPPQ